MAYKVGTTIVIDDSGNVDWSRIANKPAIGAGTVTGVNVVNTSPTAGVAAAGVQGSSAAYGYALQSVSNCYVESLTGGGASGTLTITANRKYFNCNCNCRC